MHFTSSIMFIFALILALCCVIYGGVLNEPEVETTVASQCSGIDVYHEETDTCYPVGEQGPCGKNAVIQSNYNGTGSCNCYDTPMGSKCGVRPSVLWPRDSGCYGLFDQDPCGKGEWLVSLPEGPKCEPNPCLNHPTTTNETFVFIHEKKCYETESQAFCNNSEIVIFDGYGIFEPRCVNNATGACMVAFGMAKLGPADCPSGQTPGVDGACEEISSYS